MNSTALRVGARVVLACLVGPLSSHAQVSPDPVVFDGRRGQIEVGGPFVGAEFHHSRPVPNRISFYYPVANSIDLSTDYWKRDESRPLRVAITVDGEREELEEASYPYEWMPYRVRFSDEKQKHRVEVEYRFGSSLPLMAVHVRVTNTSGEAISADISTDLTASLRTSHAYVHRDSARVRYLDGTFTADFDEADTDSAQVFVMNEGEEPLPRKGTISEAPPRAEFDYRKTLPPGESLEVIQLIGTAPSREADEIRRRAGEEWLSDVDRYERRAAAYSSAVPSIPDSAFAETARWSKAVLFANRHYIDGRIVPMPAPAEYNFFFTHDALVTDLGAVMFDTDRVRDDLRFLRSLAQGDSLLPHAYYWRDGAFRTEFARADNWNHHWFLILAASYLKHSGDSATVAELHPIMEKSVEMILQHEHDGIMYSIQPDWWDVGNVYGARAYSTILTVRALEAYTYTSNRLGKTDLSEYVRLAKLLQSRLSEAFWDEEAGYLLNMIDSTTVDRHYYAGSLLAAAFDLLDDEKKNRLLETAGRELLDERIGIRNVMPADFQDLIDVYRFQGMEAGEAYVYLNGGVWPQNIAWYALGLISANRPDEAREVMSKYLTLEGIRNSPLGQPSFFEYRNANRESPEYGKIDKPTFLWAGGWFLHVLYKLAGVREDAWNVWLDTRFPSGWSELSYDVMVEGAVTRVEWKGAGPAFHAIRWDGRPAYSAVLTEPVGRVELERGLPQEPYLARATAAVGEVTYEGGSLSVILQGEPQQQAAIEVVSMTRPVRVEVDSTAVSGVQVSREESGVITLRIPIVFHATTAGVDLEFEEPLQRD